MEILGIVLSLGLLMYLAYRGLPVILIAPFMALLAASFNQPGSLVAIYTHKFMPALGGYLIKFFPLFLFGALFGKLMDKSGHAQTISQYIVQGLGTQHAILAVVLSCGLLTYGGVSLFVVAFCVYPVAKSLFRQAGVHEDLIPASIALGSFTFTMTALPGTPAIQNALPMPYYSTDAFAAPLLGIVAGLIMFIGGVFWLNRRAQADRAQESVEGEKTLSGLDFFRSLAPLLVLIGLNFVLAKLVFPAKDWRLVESSFQLKAQNIYGLWAIIVSVVVGCLVCLLTSKNKVEVKSFQEGAVGSLLPVFNTASEVGYGAVIASLAGFGLIKSVVLGLFPSLPLASQALAINVLAGITGSASGGLSIALEALGPQFLDQAQSFSISAEVMHRVAVLACGGLDALPHNGAVITLLAICGRTHKQSYKDIFVVAVLIPLMATVVAIVLASLGVI